VKKAEFLPQLAHTIEADADTMSESTVLNELPNWDSMRLLEVIALVDEQLGVNLNANQLAKCETVGQILDILGDKLTAS
jgi:acyl carrier protein